MPKIDLYIFFRLYVGVLFFSFLQTIRSLRGETLEMGDLGCLLIKALVQRFALQCHDPSLVPSTMCQTFLVVAGTPLS